MMAQRRPADAPLKRPFLKGIYLLFFRTSQVTWTPA